MRVETNLRSVHNDRVRRCHRRNDRNRRIANKMECIDDCRTGTPVRGSSLNVREWTVLAKATRPLIVNHHHFAYPYN